MERGGRGRAQREAWTAAYYVGNEAWTNTHHHDSGTDRESDLGGIHQPEVLTGQAVAVYGSYDAQHTKSDAASCSNADKMPRTLRARARRERERVGGDGVGVERYLGRVAKHICGGTEIHHAQEERVRRQSLRLKLV